MSTHSPTVNTNRQRHQRQALTVAKVLTVLTYFILLSSAVLFTSLLPQSWKILPPALSQTTSPLQTSPNSHLQAALPGQHTWLQLLRQGASPGPAPSNTPDSFALLCLPRPSCSWLNLSGYVLITGVWGNNIPMSLSLEFTGVILRRGARGGARTAAVVTPTMLCAGGAVPRLVAEAVPLLLLITWAGRALHSSKPKWLVPLIFCFSMNGEAERFFVCTLSWWNS